ncbi:MAG: hypothetical protein HZA31_04585 [Opitutae bacterium]|nr:hypothetical protein [Opitutae bacterium]
MKKLLLIPAALVLICAGAGLYLLFGGAYGRIVVPGPAHRFGTAAGRAYCVRDPSRSFDVNLERLLPYLKNADWTSDHWIPWKIPYVVEFHDGRKMKIDQLGGHFAIEGVQGVFFVTDLTQEQKQIFYAELNAVLQEQPSQQPLGTPDRIPSSPTEPAVRRP